VKVKYLIRLLILLMFLSGFCFVGGSVYLQRSLPRRPIESSGNIIPRNIHGAWVYGTEREWLIYDALFYGLFAFGLPAGFLRQREQRLGRE
jgi:hypothetical protein